jgi:hypothetical protein
VPLLCFASRAVLGNLLQLLRKNETHSAQDGDDQGDQIGRSFAHWAIVYFVHFFEDLRSSENFIQCKIYATILTKNGLGYIFFSQAHLVALTTTTTTTTRYGFTKITFPVIARSSRNVVLCTPGHTSEKIHKIGSQVVESRPGCPDWSIFFLLGTCLQWAVFLTTEVAQNCWAVFFMVIFYNNFVKNRLGNILGDFSQVHLVTLLTLRVWKCGRARNGRSTTMKRQHQQARRFVQEWFGRHPFSA